MHRVVRKILRAVADHDPAYNDMYTNARHAFFGRLYVEWIARYAQALGIAPPATVLEAGCQAGRLAIPLAKLGFQVTGIDTSGFAIRQAKRHAAQAGVQVKWRRGDLVKVLPRERQACYDMVVCAEVLYLSPEYRRLLEALAQAVRPGGLLCVSHRPVFYYVVEALREQDLAAAREVAQRREGPFRESAYFNWQTEDELHRMYADLGLTWVASHPIDRFAWLSGTDVARLSEEERDRWLACELSTPSEHPEASRYVLVIAQRPTA